METKALKWHPSDWSKIHKLTPIKLGKLPHLADCPWPPSNGHCSPCTIHRRSDRVQFPIWGEYGGDPSRKRFYAQTSCIDVTTIKRITLMAFKRGSGTPTDCQHGGGLLIGLVDEATLNDPDKLYDPSTWWWAGCLSDLPTGNEYYYICTDINQNWPPDEYLFLLAATNESYDEPGWSIGGYGINLPLGRPLWRYNMNEPGQGDGWEAMDEYWHLCFIPYTQGGGQVIEGDISIENPNFPPNATSGEPWTATFDLINNTAFPCGCPETICWDIIDRDTGDIIIPTQSIPVDCGYMGLTTSAGITFTGSGTFHGRLRTTHDVSGTCDMDNPDDTYDFDVIVSGVACEDYTTQPECEAAGCYWYNGSCHTSPQDEVFLAEAVTCEWCTGWQNHGPMVTQFDYGDTIHVYLEWGPDTHDFYGETIGFKWYHNGEMVWEETYPITEHWYGVYWCLNWANLPHGTGYIEAYHNGNYLGKTNDYSIVGGDVIGSIDFDQSTFYTGPFNPGTYQLIAIVWCENVGSVAGNIYVKKFIDGEEVEFFWFENRQPGVPWNCCNFYWTIPENAFTAGIKVWGEGESEPPWGAMGTKIFKIQRN